MRKQYRLEDTSCGEYRHFQKIFDNPEECHRAAEIYKLQSYMILERKVTPWTNIWTGKRAN